MPYTQEHLARIRERNHGLAHLKRLGLDSIFMERKAITVAAIFFGNRVCTDCGVTKTIDQFPKRKGRPSPHAHCLKCHNMRWVAKLEHNQTVAKAYRQTPVGKASMSKANRNRRAVMKGAFVEPVDHIQLLALQNWNCFKCGLPMLPSGKVEAGIATMDHLVPYTKGGKHSNSNCLLMHHSCNARKNNRRIDVWFHPALVGNFLEMLGEADPVEMESVSTEERAQETVAREYFDVIDRVNISDPCFLPGSKYAEWRLPAVPGRWVGFVVDEPGWRSIYAHHVDFEPSESSEWIELVQIGVDSGCAGVFASEKVPQVEGEAYSQFNKRIEKAIFGPDGSLMPEGFVSGTARGDGVYPAYVLKGPKNRVTAIVIDT